MIPLELTRLERAEALFEAGKLDEAYAILKNLINDNELNFDQKVHIQFLMGLICTYQNKGEEVIDAFNALIIELYNKAETLSSLE